MRFFYRIFSKEITHSFLIGFSFGIIFPLISFTFLIIESSLQFSLNSLYTIHKQNTILVFIDIAPIILGFFGSVLGLRQLNILKAYEKLLKIDSISKRFIPNHFLKLSNKTDITKVNPGDHFIKEMTILFINIKDYYSLTENLSFSESSNLINNFYQIVSTIVTKNNGYIENFSGDFTWSIFPNSPSEALKSGIEIKSKLDELNLSRKEKNQLLIRAGFGLHTDEISVGIVGNSHRMDSILFGEAVEVAQRIEKLTNSFKTWLLLSEQTAIKLGEENDFHVREIDIVKFKNKENLIAIYECYDIDSLDIKSKKEEYKLDLNMGIAMLRENEFKEAETIFKKCLKYCPEDPIPVIYISKCHEKNSETFELSKDNEKPNILIIDDNEMIISLAERFLLKHKFKVISANSGAQALPLYTNFNPDLILLDLHFPDKNGFDIIIDIRELESQFPNQSKIILMTADNSAEIIYRGEELGVDGFIIKPIFEETLIKKIQEVLKSPINL